MANIFTLENIDNFSEKINIDELYEKKRVQDLSKLALFNKILNRIHVKIKTASRQKVDEQFCWYLVPETMIGVPKYDQAACIAYIIDKLKTNGFNVRYIHPNLLFISWLHWIPSYVRTELKKKTGILINEYGQRIEENEDDNGNKSITNIEPSDPNDYLLNRQDPNQKGKAPKKEYTPIKSYKPSGNLVYDNDLLDKLENKFR
jgi:hypothetical protein